MSRGGNKKKQIQNRISELEIRKRNGMMRAIVAFVGLAVCIAVKLHFEYQGAEWANSMYASLALFILALVAAGVAGMGTRAWKKCRDEIRALEAKLSK